MATDGSQGTTNALRIAQWLNPSDEWYRLLIQDRHLFTWRLLRAGLLGDRLDYQAIVRSHIFECYGRAKRCTDCAGSHFDTGGINEIGSVTSDDNRASL